ncbi:hypothetical protein [Streptomyces inhibens]|uniref:hypothetical protein n=1 Tax=Streptomyces inhibens TaxID=2293571 RepID=UPI001EE76CB2|nr:hypothetical protein [Streptomyces inhibens]UKY54828.1 hypothetical protein KI385_42670 [Streptomyces inhibens]
MGLFMLWLKWTLGNSGQRRVVGPGPGVKPVRGENRINKVLTAVRMFLVHAVVNKAAPGPHPQVRALISVLMLF